MSETRSIQTISRALNSGKWTTVTNCFRTYEREGGRGLLVTIACSTNKNIVFALETSTNVASPEDLFADHSHELIGECETLRSAKRLAEGYAKKWLAKGVATSSCDCARIAS